MNSSKPKLALVFDVEATGAAPGCGSMVMLGIVAVLRDQPSDAAIREDNSDSWVVDRKLWCLEELDGRSASCEREFWSKQQDLRKYILERQQHPTAVMQELNAWLKKLSERYSWFFVAWPAAFDWQWLNFTWCKYGVYAKSSGTIAAVESGALEDDEFVYIGYKADCMNITVPMSSKARAQWKKYTTPKVLVSTHNALDDALSQAYAYLKTREFFAAFQLKKE